MSYDQQKADIILLPPTSLADAAFVAGSRSYPATPQMVRSLWATITAAVATAACVVTYTYRPTPGSATGQITLGTLTLPLAAAAGKFFYKNLATAQKIMPGGEIVVSFSGGSGAGGLAAVGMTTDPSWDSPSNNVNAVASA
jgi:hypothetical protein